MKDYNNIEKAKDLFNKVYNGMLDSMHEVVSHGYFNVDFVKLLELDPTVRQRADLAKAFVGTLETMAAIINKEYSVTVLVEYVDLLSKIADAVDEKDDVKLQECFEILKRKPFISEK